MIVQLCFIVLCLIVESSPLSPSTGHNYYGSAHNNVWDEDEEILARASHRLDLIGEPLLLTPLIKLGHIGEAQGAARVKNLTHLLSYSGFLTVNAEFGSNLFFWFFPSQIKPDTAPLILWLQGGPGESSLFGLFTEHGPFHLYDSTSTLTLRSTTWTQSHSVIYMDSPVGAGFSYTLNDQGYAKNEEDVAQNLYEALLQFFELFPGYRKNDFFVAGESYGGKYVPAISWKIHRANMDLSTAMNDTNKLKIINLKGLAMGNAFTDPVSTLVYSDLLYDLGLIDLNERRHFILEEERARESIHYENYLAAFKTMDKLVLGSKSTSQPSYFERVTGLKATYNLLRQHQDPPGMVQNLTNFVQQDWVRSSIHVGNRPFLHFDLGGPVSAHMEEDIYKSVKSLLEELLDAPKQNYRILFYTGQLDLCVGVMANNNLIKNLRWDGAAAFELANKKIWRVKRNGREEEVAGYSKSYKFLTQLIVRNAGHRVPYDQPEWALNMISRFTAKTTTANFSWSFDNPLGN